jgi:hypothetical protein
MPLKLSTGLANVKAGKVAQIVGTDLTFTASGNVIASAANALLTAGFRPDDIITISGSGAGNNAIVTVTSVASTGATMVVSAITGDESDNASLTITGTGKGIAQALKYGALYVYTGTQVANADASEGSVTLLAILTKDGGTVTAGTKTNGLELDETAIAAGKVSKKSGDTWKGTGLANGTAGWGRFYDNALQTGVDASEEAIRVDGQCGSSYQFKLSNLSIEVGVPITCDQFSLTERTAAPT